MHRQRAIGSPAALLRGLLASQLFGYSLRQLSAFGVLSSIGDLSETAWRKRLRQSRAWLEWIVQRKRASTTAHVPWLLAKGLRRCPSVNVAPALAFGAWASGRGNKTAPR